VGAGRIVLSQIESYWHGLGKGQGKQGGLSVQQGKVPSHGHGDIIFHSLRQCVAVIQLSVENVVINIAEHPPRLIDFPGLACDGGAMNLTKLIKIGVAGLNDFVVEKGDERIGVATIKSDTQCAQPCIPIEAVG
jgi:hypothetical protein